MNQSPIWLAVVKTIPQHLLSLRLGLLLCESAAGCRPEVGGGPDGLAGLSSSVFFFFFLGLSADQRLFWSCSPKRNAACLNVLIKMTLVPAGVVLTIEVSACFRSERSYPDSVRQYNDPLSCSSPQV